MMKNQIGGSIWRKTTKNRMNAAQQTSKVVIIVVIVFVAHREGLRKGNSLNSLHIIPYPKSILLHGQCNVRKMVLCKQTERKVLIGLDIVFGGFLRV